MKVKRNSIITIILSAIAAIILLTISFLLGTCSVNAGKTDNTDNTANTVGNNSGDNRDVVAITLAPSADDNSSQNDESITYSNTKYGFEFVLPSSWLGYTIETEVWKGTAITGDKLGKVIETGETLTALSRINTNQEDFTNSFIF